MKRLLFFLLFLSQFSFANPYQIELISSFTEIQKNKTVPIALRIQLDPSWYTYWSYPGDFGKKINTSWDTPKSIQILPQAFPRPDRYTFEINQKNYASFIYKKEVLIFYDLFIPNNYSKSNLPIVLDVEFFICKDICISKKEVLKLDLKISKKFKQNSNFALFKKWQDQQPKNLSLDSFFERKPPFLFIHFEFQKYIECLDLFPNSLESFSTHKPILLNQTQNSCSFKVRKISSLPTLSGLITYQDQAALQSSLFNSYEKKSFGLIGFILLAFLGGLLLNIMPCVLPIIFLKFYHTLSASYQSKKENIKLTLSYVVGVIFSFLALAFFIFISKKAGESIGWGFHLQSPLFVTLIALLFLGMAFYLLNLLTLPLPRISINFQNQKMAAHFVTGVLSTIAASPCTVPFMAPAVGFAFSRSWLEIFTIFFFLGLGLSFPYILLSFYPQLLNKIPLSNQWMNKIKSLLSIPLFLTVLWLVYLLHKQLDPQVFIATLFLFPFAIAIIGIQKVMPKSLSKTLVLLFLFILSLGLLVFQKYSKQQLYYSNQDALFIKGLHWHPFSQKSLETARENGENILVSIGAQWCLTCKVNERIFKKQDIQASLKANQVKLYYGDWTNRNPYITHFLNLYGQSGIPFYILYQGKDKTQILPSFLLKNATLESLNHFFKK